MNIHKNARLTFIRRVEMLEHAIKDGVRADQIAQLYGVGAAIVCERPPFGEGSAALADRSSRPACSRHAIGGSKTLFIVELRKKRMTQASIAEYPTLSKAAVSRVLTQAGMARLPDLEPAEPVQRYEHERPGDQIHTTRRSWAAWRRPGHRLTGDRSARSRGASWEVLFVALDDHTRIAYPELYPDKSQENACRFLANAHTCYSALDGRPKALLTDNGSAFRARTFGRLRTALELKHRYTRPHRAKRNRKAECFIQSALRELAYAFVYNNSDERTDMLSQWNHLYDWRRPH